MLKGTVHFIKTEFWGDKRRFQDSIKVALACAIAAAVSNYLDLHRGMWGIITVLVIAGTNVSFSVDRSLQRIVGTVVGGLTGAWLVSSLGQEMWLYLPAEFAVLTVTIYLGTGKWHPYSFLVCAFSNIICGLSLLENQQNTINVALSRIIEVILGIISYQLVNSLIWPYNAKDGLAGSMAATLNNIGRLLRVTAGIRTTAEPPAAGAVMHSLAQAFSRNSNLLQRAMQESRPVAMEGSRLKDMVATMEHMASLAREIESLRRSLATGRIPAPVAESIDLLCIGMAQTLEQIAKAIKHDDVTNAVTGLAPVSGKAALLVDMLASSGDEAGGDLHLLAGDLERMAALVDRLSAPARPPRPPAPDSRPAGVPGPDRARLRHAILASLCSLVFVVPLVYWHLSFAPAAIVMIVLISLTNIGTMQGRALLAYVGCVAGGGVALMCLFFLIPQMTLLWQELAMISAVFFAFAYVKYGSNRISFAGTYMGVAFTIVGILDTAPRVSMIPVLNSVLGLVIGTMVGSYLFLWALPAYDRRKTATRADSRGY
ncbi:MAG: FUSC family protein [Myxococcota bacterium]|jgi:uncharacterized membrane protein YccC